MPKLLVKVNDKFAIWSTTEGKTITELMTGDKMKHYLIAQEQAWESNYGLSTEVREQIKSRVDKMFDNAGDINDQA